MLCVWTNLPTGELIQEEITEEINLSGLGLCTKDNDLEKESTEEHTEDILIF